jgi:hypothetical protein
MVGELIDLLVEGFRLVGAAVTGFIKLVLVDFAHLPVEDWMISVAVIFLLLVMAWKYGKKVPKLVLIVLVLVIVAIVANAFIG